MKKISLLFVSISLILLYLYTQSSKYLIVSKIAIEGRDTNLQTTIDTQIEIISSRPIIIKALEIVDYSHHYYRGDKELYQESPFEVNLTRGYNREFRVYPYDDKHYRVVSRDINRTYLYNQEVVEKSFAFTLHTKDKTLDSDSYKFIVLDTQKSIALAQKELSVDRVGWYSSVIRVSKRDTIASRAIELVDTIVDIYITQQNLIDPSDKSTISKELERSSKSIEALELRLEEFRRDTNYMTNSLLVENRVKELDRLKERLLNLNIELELINNLQQRLKSTKKYTSLLLAGIYSNNKILVESIEDLQKSIIKINTLLADYTVEYPDVVRLNRYIINLKKTIITITKNIKKSYQKEKKLVEEHINKIESIISKIPQNSRVYTNLKEELSSKRELYNYLLKEQLKNIIREKQSSMRVYIIDRGYCSSDFLDIIF